jgi:hypothetical protein
MAARTTARRVIVSTLLAVLFGLLFASSAAAHAELTNITPASGAQLTRPPVEVRMTFTESVNLVAGGIRLIDDRGATVRTPNPTIAGHTSTCRCRWSYRMGPTSSPGGSCRPMGIRSVDHCPCRRHGSHRLLDNPWHHSSHRAN